MNQAENTQAHNPLLPEKKRYCEAKPMQKLTSVDLTLSHITCFTWLKLIRERKKYIKNKALFFNHQVGWKNPKKLGKKIDKKQNNQLTK